MLKRLTGHHNVIQLFELIETNAQVRVLARLHNMLT